MNQTPNEITDCALLGCLCKCHVEDEEDPGPHLSTCYWSDPEFPRPTGLVVLEGGQTAPHVVGSWDGATTATVAEEGDACGLQCPGNFVRARVEDCACHINPPCAGCVEAGLVCSACGREAKEDRTMLHGHTPPPLLVALAPDLRPTDPASVARLGRLVGYDRGANEGPQQVAFREATLAEAEAFREKYRKETADRRCPWMKIASATEAAQCMRKDGHHTSNDPAERDAHDYTGAELVPRAPLPAVTITSKYVGAWDPREQPGARVELTDEQVRDFTGATAEEYARLIAESPTAQAYVAGQEHGDGASPPIVLDAAGKPYAFAIGTGPWNVVSPFAEEIAKADALIDKLAIPASMISGPDVRPRRVRYDYRPAEEPRPHGQAAELVDARHRPWFLTVTGRQFFYDDPEGYPFDIEEIAHSLSNICRFAGHLDSFYSVAEHSVLVARAVGQEAWRVLKHPGDLTPLLRAAALHDGSEAFMLDLPRPLKRLPGLEGYCVLEDRVQLAIERRFGLEGHHGAKAIKRADTAVLAAEKLQLRPPHPFGERGDIVEGVEPADVTCRSLPPREAMQFFLECWHELGGSR